MTIMRREKKIMLGAGGFFVLLASLSLFYSAKNFWAVSRMREVSATVVASSLKIDWGREEFETNEIPLYLMSVELLADDGSGRVFHWSGDPGKAAYPEEALDEFALWQKGTRHRVAMLRGNARELRMEHLEDNPEQNAGIGWLFAAFFSAMIGVAFFASAGIEIGGRARLGFLRGMGMWTVFLAFGLLPLFGSVLFGWGMANRILSWEQVSAHKVGESIAFDTTLKIPGVEVTLNAATKLAENPYDRVEFQWKGRTLLGGIGKWGGVHDRGMSSGAGNGEYQFFISPKNRWDMVPNLSWGEDFWVPFGILLFFGFAFTGASLIIRKSEGSFRKFKAPSGR